MRKLRYYVSLSLGDRTTVIQLPDGAVGTGTSTESEVLVDAQAEVLS